MNTMTEEIQSKTTKNHVANETENVLPTESETVCECQNSLRQEQFQKILDETNRQYATALSNLAK